MTGSSVTETIGQRLLRLREDRGLSQRKLAEPGVGYCHISRIEHGHGNLSVNALRKLAPKLGVSAEYLETGKEPSPRLECCSDQELIQELQRRGFKVTVNITIEKEG
ncbi:MAG: helix-turn-helix transcriptional regulator [Candidatus Colwellbacteria bacterium]|nr:helix-turn-helix transcriptional regulator [Candidatus Colwellbacteria bacterium]